MNSYERTIARLRGKPVDRPPNFNIIMGFGMRFLGRPLVHYFVDPLALVEAHLAMVETFGVDVVSIIADSYREAADLGAEVIFPEDGLPYCPQPLFYNPTDLAHFRLSEPIVGKRMGDAVESIHLFRRQIGGEVPVMGWVEGALAQANILVRDQTLMFSLYDQPEWVLDLLEFCTEVEIAFARAQIEAGADIIGLGDAIASLLSPQMYTRFALPFERRIFAAVHQMGALARLHICGNTSHLLPLMAQSGADIIDLDWMVDLRQAAELFVDVQDAPALCGNFDPVVIMLQGTPEQVQRAVLDGLEAGGTRLFSAAGCEIPEGTPHQNLLMHARTLKEYGGG